MLRLMTLARTLTIPVEGSRQRLEARLTDKRSSAGGELSARAPEGALGPSARWPEGALGLELALIAPPHPMYGGTNGNPVVKALESALQTRGLATLAFNFRGTGDEAEGQPSGEYDDALQDYLGAARALPDARLHWLCGYSFGGVAALASALELGAERVLMVAPPLAMLDPTLLTRYHGQIAVLVGTEDEYAPLEALRALFEPRPQTTLELLPNVDHFFLGSDVQRLAEGLTRLLDKTDPGKPPHVA